MEEEEQQIYLNDIEGIEFIEEDEGDDPQITDSAPVLCASASTEDGHSSDTVVNQNDCLQSVIKSNQSDPHTIANYNKETLVPNINPLFTNCNETFGSDESDSSRIADESSESDVSVPSYRCDSCNLEFADKSDFGWHNQVLHGKSDKPQVVAAAAAYIRSSKALAASCNFWQIALPEKAKSATGKKRGRPKANNTTTAEFPNRSSVIQSSSGTLVCSKPQSSLASRLPHLASLLRSSTSTFGKDGCSGSSRNGVRGQPEQSNSTASPTHKRFKSAGNTTPSHVCDYCALTFSQKSDLDRHRKILHGNVNVTLQTGNSPTAAVTAENKNASGFENESERVGSSPYWYICGYCSQATFCKMSDFNLHQQVWHPNVKPLVFVAEKGLPSDAIRNAAAQRIVTNRENVTAAHEPTRTDFAFVSKSPSVLPLPESPADTFGKEEVRLPNAPTLQTFINRSSAETVDLPRASFSSNAYVCNYCTLSFTNQPDLDWHNQVSHGKMFVHLRKETNDSYITNAKSYLSNHISDVHDKKIMYFCKVCPFKTATRRGLFFHRRVVTEDGAFACDSCSHRFRSMKSWEAHAELHSEKSYACPLCSFVCSVDVHYLRHLKEHVEFEDEQ